MHLFTLLGIIVTWNVVAQSFTLQPQVDSLPQVVHDCPAEEPSCSTAWQAADDPSITSSSKETKVKSKYFPREYSSDQQFSELEARSTAGNDLESTTNTNTATNHIVAIADKSTKENVPLDDRGMPRDPPSWEPNCKGSEHTLCCQGDWIPKVWTALQCIKRMSDRSFPLFHSVLYRLIAEVKVLTPTQMSPSVTAMENGHRWSLPVLTLPHNLQMTCMTKDVG